MLEVGHMYMCRQVVNPFVPVSEACTSFKSLVRSTVTLHKGDLMTIVSKSWPVDFNNNRALRVITHQGLFTIFTRWLEEFEEVKL